VNSLSQYSRVVCRLLSTLFNSRLHKVLISHKQTIYCESIRYFIASNVSEHIILKDSVKKHCVITILCYIASVRVIKVFGIVIHLHFREHLIELGRVTFAVLGFLSLGFLVFGQRVCGQQSAGQSISSSVGFHRQ
jgi:hypothetical protein